MFEEKKLLKSKGLLHLIEHKGELYLNYHITHGIDELILVKDAARDLSKAASEMLDISSNPDLLTGKKGKLGKFSGKLDAYGWLQDFRILIQKRLQTHYENNPEDLLEDFSETHVIFDIL